MRCPSIENISEAGQVVGTVGMQHMPAALQCPRPMQQGSMAEHMRRNVGDLHKPEGLSRAGSGGGIVNQNAFGPAWLLPHGLCFAVKLLPVRDVLSLPRSHDDL